MFSPSLLSMILHSVGSEMGLRAPVEHPTMREVAQDLHRLVTIYGDSNRPMPAVPIIGHIDDPRGLQPYVEFSERYSPGGSATLGVWGRVPIDVLVARLLDRYDRDPLHEYLDVGTPLAKAQRMGSDLTGCTELLNRQPLQQGQLRLAVIDRGESVLGAQADNLGGRIHHLQGQDVVFSDHATKVLETLLVRLDAHGITPCVELIVGLVAPPLSHIGRRCFEHANTVELQSTFQALSRHVGRGGTPVVTNLSMGTHVGPHRGNSPLEDDLRQDYFRAPERVLVCSAGNDGMAGIADRRKLLPNTPECLRLRTDSRGCHELLIELWWDDVPNIGSLSVEVELTDQGGRLRGRKMSLAPGLSGTTSMQPVGARFNSVVCQSLYHARCLGTMYCTALALSATDRADLADLTIDIEVVGHHTSLELGAWVVIADDQCCAFVGGGVDSSICVPATMAEAVSVAGVNSSGQPWRHSSRGSTGSVSGAPTIAHLVHDVSGSDEGTSYSAPRVSADIAERVLRMGTANLHAGASQPHSRAVHAVAPLFAWSPTPLVWNPRTGYGGCATGP